MGFLAHTSCQSDQPQLLKDHLLNTAEKTRAFCCLQDNKDLFYLAGLLHDFGKYQFNFQKYLVYGGRKGSVPHARWGIFFQGKEYPELAFVICGHHKGLQNRAALIQEFILENEEIIELEKMKKNFLSEMENYVISPYSPAKKEISITERELLIRYLFSCLTDADWLDTEHYMSIDKFSMRETIPLQAAQIFDKLKGTSKNYVLRNPISQKTRKSLHDNGIKVNYQIFQSASTDFLISKQERMQIPFKNSPIEIYNDTCCMSNSLN